jgi:hypothetical protein
LRWRTGYRFLLLSDAVRLGSGSTSGDAGHFAGENCGYIAGFENIEKLLNIFIGLSRIS